VNEAPDERDWTRFERWLSEPRVEFAIGAVIVALAFVLRVAHVLASRACPLFDAPQMDALYHVEWARAVVAGVEFQPGPFFRAQLYPWMLAAVLRVFGDGLLAPRLVQCVLGAASVAFVWRSARRVLDARAGLCAALIAATYWVSIFYDGELLLESLCTPLFAAATWATLGARDRDRARDWALAGVLWGLGAITRPNVLAALPLLAVWCAWRGAGLRRTLVFAAACIAPIVPITAYNIVEGQDRVLIASQGGVNLWIGNNPQSDGAGAIVPGAREDWWGGYYDAIAQAQTARGRALKPSEVSAYYSELAWRFLRTQPRRAAQLFMTKLRLLWLDWEIGNNEEPRFLALEYSPWLRWTPMSWGGLVALALAALAPSARASSRAAPVWIFVGAYAATLVVFSVNSRFRVPMVPQLAVLAGMAPPAFADALRSKSWRAVLTAMLLASASFTLSRQLPDGVERRSESNGELILGASALRSAKLDEARARLERSLALEPLNHIALRTLAQTLLDQGDAARAAELFARTRELRAGDPFSFEGETSALLALERVDDALDVARKFTEAAPSSALAWLTLGRVSFRRGDGAGARAGFGRALELEPDSFDAAYSLAAVDLYSSRRREALNGFERALAHSTRADPAFVEEAFVRAIELSESLGESDRARRISAQALERFGADSRCGAVAQRVLGS